MDIDLPKGDVQYFREDNDYKRSQMILFNFAFKEMVLPVFLKMLALFSVYKYTIKFV